MASIGSLSVTLGLSSGQFVAGLRDAAGAVTGFAQHMAVSGTGLMGGLLAGVGGITGLVKEAVSAAADMESLELSFQGIAGGAKEARDLVKDIANFAAETPFETMPLANSVKLLSTMGFEAREALGIIQKLGDVVAASGKGSEGLNQVALALGQIRLMGKLQGQDAMQLTNAGIPIWDALSKRLGKTTAQVRHLSEQGGIDARTAILAVLDVADDPKFKGSQERLSKSLSGLWSTLKDNTTLALADLGKVIAESFDLKGTATQITNFIGFLRTQMEGLRPVLSLVGAGFGALRDTVLTALKDITETLKTWGMTIDGSTGRLANLRTIAIDAFETIAKWVNTGLNAMVRFGGFMLANVVAPILEGVQQILLVFAKLANALNQPKLEESLTNLAGGLFLPRARADLIGKKLMEQPLDAGADSITGFFKRVRLSGFEDIAKGFGLVAGAVANFAHELRTVDWRLAKGGEIGEWATSWLGRGLGIANQLGLFGKENAPFNLSVPGGMATTPPKLAPSALINSAEAYKLIGGDINQRAGGGTRDVPMLIKGLWDTGRNIERIVAPLIPLIQANGIGLVFPNG